MKKLFFFGLMMLFLQSGFSQHKRYFLKMFMDGTHELYDGHVTNSWGFDFFATEGNVNPFSIPSPTLTAIQGDTVTVLVYNASGEGHTIHWHGLDVDQANDGVPHTSGFVLTGDTFTYKFVATHAGNFIYHCHVTTTLHLMMGMYGSFIVYPKESKNQLFDGGPKYASENTFLGSELNSDWNDDFMNSGLLNEFYPTHFLISGKQNHQILEDSTLIVNLKRGQNTLIRLLNIGFSAHQYTFPEGVNAIVYTSDGRALNKPFYCRTLTLFPGERYSVILSTQNQLLQDYIVVDYLDLYQLKNQGRNYIGINTNQFPTQIKNVLKETSNSVFPNPTNDFLHLPKGANNIQLINNQGQIIGEYHSSNVINMAGLPSGNYTVIYKLESDKPVQQKFIKF